MLKVTAVKVFQFFFFKSYVAIGRDTRASDIAEVARGLHDICTEEVNDPLINR